MEPRHLPALDQGNEAVRNQGHKAQQEQSEAQEARPSAKPKNCDERKQASKSADQLCKPPKRTDPRGVFHLLYEIGVVSFCIPSCPRYACAAMRLRRVGGTETFRADAGEDEVPLWRLISSEACWTTAIALAQTVPVKNRRTASTPRGVTIDQHVLPTDRAGSSSKLHDFLMLLRHGGPSAALQTIPGQSVQAEVAVGAALGVRTDPASKISRAIAKKLMPPPQGSF